MIDKKPSHWDLLSRIVHPRHGWLFGFYLVIGRPLREPSKTFPRETSRCTCMLFHSMCHLQWLGLLSLGPNSTPDREIFHGHRCRYCMMCPQQRPGWCSQQPRSRRQRWLRKKMERRMEADGIGWWVSLNSFFLVFQENLEKSDELQFMLFSQVAHHFHLHLWLLQ